MFNLGIVDWVFIDMQMTCREYWSEKRAMFYLDDKIKNLFAVTELTGMSDCIRSGCEMRIWKLKHVKLSKPHKQHHYN